MAARQTKFNSLAPAEKEKQEKWAQTQLQQNAGKCKVGFGWFRVLSDGYICGGGSHMVTDELLVEGKGGYYTFGSYKRDKSIAWDGPLYTVNDMRNFAMKRRMEGLKMTQADMNFFLMYEKDPKNPRNMARQMQMEEYARSGFGLPGLGMIQPVYTGIAWY